MVHEKRRRGVCWGSLSNFCLGFPLGFTPAPERVYRNLTNVNKRYWPLLLAFSHSRVRYWLKAPSHIDTSHRYALLKTCLCANCEPGVMTDSASRKQVCTAER